MLGGAQTQEASWTRVPHHISLAGWRAGLEAGSRRSQGRGCLHLPPVPLHTACTESWHHASCGQSSHSPGSL